MINKNLHFLEAITLLHIRSRNLKSLRNTTERIPSFEYIYVFKKNNDIVGTAGKISYLSKPRNNIFAIVDIWGECPFPIQEQDMSSVFLKFREKRGMNRWEKYDRLSLDINRNLSISDSTIKNERQIACKWVLSSKSKVKQL